MHPVKGSFLLCLGTLQLWVFASYWKSACIRWWGRTHCCRYRVDVAQIPLGLTLSSHLLQWWQAELDDCSVPSYSGVSTLPQFDLLMFHHHWADLGNSCSVSGSHDTPFLFFYYFLHMGGPDLPLEHLLWVTTSFLITMQLPVIDKHEPVLFSISSSSLGEFWHLCLAWAPALLPVNLCPLVSP